MLKSDKFVRSEKGKKGNSFFNKSIYYIFNGLYNYIIKNEFLFIIAICYKNVKCKIFHYIYSK